MTKSKLLFVTLLLAGCLRQSQLTSYSRFDSGKFVGFVKSPTEHIIVETQDPIVLREVRGVLRSPSGEWSENAEVVFEIKGPLPTETIRSARVDPSGRFQLRSVPVGNYFFKATASGFQSIVGTIVVSKSAKANQVDLTMLFGV